MGKLAPLPPMHQFAMHSTYKQLVKLELTARLFWNGNLGAMSSSSRCSSFGARQSGRDRAAAETRVDLASMTCAGVRVAVYLLWRCLAHQSTDSPIVLVPEPVGAHRTFFWPSKKSVHARRRLPRNYRKRILLPALRVFSVVRGRSSC